MHIMPSNHIPGARHVPRAGSKLLRAGPGRVEARPGTRRCTPAIGADGKRPGAALRALRSGSDDLAAGTFGGSHA